MYYVSLILYPAGIPQQVQVFQANIIFFNKRIVI